MNEQFESNILKNEIFIQFIIFKTIKIFKISKLFILLN
jgi:hypothetical protein